MQGKSLSLVYRNFSAFLNSKVIKKQLYYSGNKHEMYTSRQAITFPFQEMKLNCLEPVLKENLRVPQEFQSKGGLPQRKAGDWVLMRCLAASRFSLRQLISTLGSANGALLTTHPQAKRLLSLFLSRDASAPSSAHQQGLMYPLQPGSPDWREQNQR